MAFSAARFRRWFAAAIVVVCLVVAGAYFYARHRVQNALKQVPERLNIQVQQSAQAFTISKSEQGRTLFKLQANKAVQFKGTGRVELTDVMVTIYGQDSTRFDQIYGKHFQYDQQSGNVTSTGEVSIDLQSNPQGITASDQATPRELKNPIHVKTTNLVFNQKTGDAWTDAGVEFHVPELNGSAVGARYSAKQSTLALQSQVKMAATGTTPLTIDAQSAILEKEPREIVLRHAQARSSQKQAQADEATLFLRDDNTLDHAVAIGNIVMHSGQNQAGPKSSPTASDVTARKLEVAMRLDDQLQTAVFSGGVHFKNNAEKGSEGFAERVVLNFGARNTLTKIHAEQQVKILQHPSSTDKNAQDVEVTAPIIDAFVADGRRLTRAETSGPPQIRLLSTQKQGRSESRITADKFTANFDSLGQLSRVHGELHTRMVTDSPARDDVAAPERVSTSDAIDAYFRPGTGAESLVQQGHFTYTSGTQQATANAARYTPANEVLLLTGAPRILDSGMQTTAKSVRFNRATGDGFAEGDVKTTYNDVKPRPDGALLASSSPIHVTADSMTAHNLPASATYKGNVRLWQDANVFEAPSMQFRKDQRMIVADSSVQNKVLTDLVSTDKNGKSMPVHITSNHLTYSDPDRKAHYEGSVVAQGADAAVAADQMDVFFAPRPPAAPANGGVAVSVQKSAQGAAQLEKIVASGSVLVTQPNRRATSDKLTYTAADDKFVLTGGPPAIFDAEHGKVTGVLLTMFRGDDRVLVEGNTTSPAVTQTQVDHTR